MILIIISLMIFLVPLNCLVNGKINDDENINRMIDDVLTFCIDKPKTDFCNPEYIKMMINSAALLKGKVPPIEHISELELEKEKLLKTIALNKAKQDQKKMERQRQRQLNAEKVKYQELMKKLDMEKKTLGKILTNFDRNGQNFFRY